MSIATTMPFGLPLRFATLPQYLKEVQPETKSHGVGKWDLGHFEAHYVPTARGFDSWYGYYSSYTSYFSHVGDLGECQGPTCFHDFNLNGKALGGVEGTYSTELFSRRAETLIERHETDKPLFLYFAPTNCHGEVQAPRELLEAKEPTLGAVPNHARRIYAACLLALDNSVERIEGALQARDMWATTVLLATSDNGAVPMEVLNTQAGSNWPLRGQKFRTYEGGTKVPAFLYSALLPAAPRGSTYAGLFHIVDVAPTLLYGVLRARGAFNASALAAHDGDSYDQWRALLGEAAAARDIVLYNIDSCLSGGSIIGAIRQGDLKLIVRELNQTWWPVPRTNAPADLFYEAFEVGDTTVPVQLYNLSADPTESRDLSAQLPGAVDALNATLQRYADGMSDAVACDQPADNKYLAIWAKRGFVSPWLDDPLYMYACSAAICPPGAPTGAPTTVSERTPRPTSDTAMPTPLPSASAGASNASIDTPTPTPRPARARLDAERRPIADGPGHAARRPARSRCRLLCLPGRRPNTSTRAQTRYGGPHSRAARSAS